MKNILTKNPSAFMRSLLPTLAVFLPISIVSCGSAVPEAQNPQIRRSDAGLDAATESSPTSLDSASIAVVPEGTLGPYVGYGDDRSMAVYAPMVGTTRRFVAQPLDANGRISGPAKDLGLAPEEAPVIVVKALNRPHLPFLALFVRKNAQGASLESLALADNAQAKGAIAIIAQSSQDILWADAYPTPTGAIIVWAEQVGARAILSSFVIDASGQPKGTATPIEKNAIAWQLVPTASGAALAVVIGKEGARSLGSVSLHLLDRSGKTSGQPTIVSSSTTAQSDIDLARVGDSLVAAWTDRRDADGQVFAAAVDMQGKVSQAAHPVTEARGDQALLALIGPSSGNPRALLALDDLAQRSAGQRKIRLLALDNKATAEGEATSLELATGTEASPDFAASSHGFVALTYAKPCPEQGNCEAKNPVASYVSFGPDLSVRGGSPIVVSSIKETPAVTWALGCTKTACSVLATGYTSPASVFSVSLNDKPIGYAKAAKKDAQTTLPSLQRNSVVVREAEHVAKMAGAEMGSSTILAWVTHFIENVGPATPGVRPDPRKTTAAKVVVQVFDKDDKALAEPQIITSRALSAGSIAVAPSDDQEAAIAWAARDAGDPQVFITKVGADGKKKAQRMVTRTKGDAQDVAIAWAGDGWILAWIDYRDGNGEVYATKIDKNLRTTVPDTRLTNSPGDAADVSLFVKDKEIFVSYSDPRDHKDTGNADVFVQKVSVAKLARVGDEVRIALTPLHSRSPKISQVGDSLFAGWIEQVVNEAKTEGTSPGIKFIRLDASSARPLGAIMTSNQTETINPTSMSFSCDQEGCRAVVSVATDESSRLDAFPFAPSRRSFDPIPLTILGGAPGQDVSPVVIGDNVYYVDDINAGDTRIRKAQVKWR